VIKFRKLFHVYFMSLSSSMNLAEIIDINLHNISKVYAVCPSKRKYTNCWYCVLIFER
jgi:hypothetical protein